MRQVAEDVSAHSAVKEEWVEKNLRRAVKKVAKKNFPEEERQYLTEAVMEAFKNGESHNFILKNGEVDRNSPENTIYLFKTMKRLRELPVAASAVKFCSELFREANSKAAKSMSEEHNKVEVELLVEKKKSLLDHIEPRRFEPRRAEANAQQEVEQENAKEAAEQESKKAEKICHKVLTGELGADDGPKWAEKAANSSQPEGQHYQLGRLQKVDATEKAWKVSLKNVCKDECIELVKEMKKESPRILRDVGGGSDGWKWMDSYEEVCAKRVVQKVEAEILGCCAESCGWNGRACMYWPFLNSTEKGQWEAECCTEFNILKNSSRATMCDATLTGNENKEVIRDEQPNRPKDRRMIGQDPVGKGTSFLQSEDTNGSTPSPEYKPISAPKGKCPKPLDLGEVHEKLKHQWKTTVSQFSILKFINFPACRKQPPKNDTIGKCTAFLPHDVNGPYVCYGECLESVPVKDLPKLETLDAKIPGNTALLYVHETIYNSTTGE